MKKDSRLHVGLNHPKLGHLTACYELIEGNVLLISLGMKDDVHLDAEELDEELITEVEQLISKI